MAKKRLIVNDDLKSKLYELRERLADIPLMDDFEMDKSVGGSCGEHCMVTCSWWCETYCEGSCRFHVKENACAYKAVCPAAPYNQ